MTVQPAAARQAPTRKRGGAGLATRQRPWHQDEAILERVEVVDDLHLQGYSTRAIAEMLRGDPKRRWPAVDHSTVAVDIQRAGELRRERHADAIDQRRELAVAQLALVARTAMRAFHDTAKTSLNRSGYLNTYRRAVMDMAKLNGLEVPAAAPEQGNPLAAFLAGMVEFERRYHAARQGLPDTPDAAAIEATLAMPAPDAAAPTAGDDAAPAWPDDAYAGGVAS